MPQGDSELTIAIPLGNPDAVAQKQRYRYDCEHRKDGQFVIIQQTHSGQGALRWRGREWSVPPGHAFVCLVPERFKYYYPKGSREPWRFAWICVYGSLARFLCQALRNAHGPVLPLPLGSTLSKEFLGFATSARNRIFREPHAITFAATAFFLNWKRLLDRPGNSAADPVETVMRTCQARFREPLGIKELAALAGISREHLTRVFSQRTGVSPARYLRQIRLTAALEILNTSRATQKEAAYRSGFSSIQALQRAIRG